MRTSIILDRIRAKCPSFARIDHILNSGQDDASPAAFVCPVQIEAKPAPFVSHHIQEASAVFGIEVHIPTRLDGAIGAGQADLLDDLRDELQAALLGWTPNSQIAPFNYEGGVLMEAARGIVVWREHYSTTYEIRKV